MVFFFFSFCLSFIIRFNLAKLAGFEEDVGVKMNMTTLNPSILYRRYRKKSNKGCLRKYTTVHVESWVLVRFYQNTIFSAAKNLWYTKIVGSEIKTLVFFTLENYTKNIQKQINKQKQTKQSKIKGKQNKNRKVTSVFVLSLKARTQER